MIFDIDNADDIFKNSILKILLIIGILFLDED